MNKRKAVIEAIENADKWANGAVVVKSGRRDYDAIPGAYLNDISYTGSRNVVLDLQGGLYPSTGYSLDDATAKEIADLLI